MEESGYIKGQMQSALSGLGKKAFYADLRVELFEGKSASALNGNIKGAEEDYEATMGARVYAKNGSVIASGHAGTTFNPLESKKTKLIAKNLLLQALKFAKANARKKEEFRKHSKFFGEMAGKTGLAETKTFTKNYTVPFKKSHHEMPLEDAVRFAENHSKSLSAKKGIASNSTGIVAGEKKKLFASSTGSLIEQTFQLTESFVYIAAKGKAMETYYDWLGNYKGLEILDGENEYKKSYAEFIDFIAEGTIEVSNAPAAKTTTKPVTVITDPWFNALLSHEIMGHPSEADRALKREAAWAGRAWWFNGMDNNLFGKQIASEQLNVFSDPSLEGYGHYRFDDEGTNGKKTFHIKNGVLNEFLNSRETAHILGKEPNGGMRAMSAEHVPLIRMNNTVIGPGKWKKEEIFADTKEGFYAVGQKTPSIGETRQNFKITCWKLYKIENGEPTTLYRQGGITADSHVFLKSIDAVGDDFNLYNIPNCGKGTPMQTMRVGNGGPHLRAKANVSGSNE